MTAVGVCGFGRSGSTMVMAMLDAGGIPPVEGASGRSYELSSGLLPAAAVEGRAVKLLDAILDVPLPSPPTWRFIWCDRHAREQAASMAKFLRGVVAVTVAPGGEEGLRRSFRRDRPLCLRRLAALGPVEPVRYEDALRDPRGVAERLRRVLAPDFDLDVDRAAAAVHDRDPACRPDLSFELHGVVPARVGAR